MADTEIEFHGPVELPLPRPCPAVQNVPGWFKRMPSETPVRPDGRQWLTLKRCPPFIDALTSGYLIPLTDDVHFSMEADGLSFSSSSPLVRTHDAEQLPRELAGRLIVKFVNPWIVKTPPGYSCLFAQPLNRFSLPFQVLSGIVETDTYYQEVHFPAVCLLKPGTSTVLKKGTPIVQAIPFRREQWHASFHALQLGKWKQAVQEIKGTSGHYKEHNWERKAFD